METSNVLDLIEARMEVLRAELLALEQAAEIIGRLDRRAIRRGYRSRSVRNTENRPEAALPHYWARKAGEEPQSAIPEVQPESLNLPVPSPSSSSPYRTHGEAAESILRRYNKGMTAHEIADKMIADGHTLPEDPQARHNTTYQAMYRRRDIFRTYRRGVWGLQEWGDELPGEDRKEKAKSDPGLFDTNGS